MIPKIIIISAITSYVISALKDMIEVSKQEKKYKEFEDKYKEFYNSLNSNNEIDK